MLLANASTEFHGIMLDISRIKYQVSSEFHTIMPDSSEFHARHYAKNFADFPGNCLLDLAANAERIFKAVEAT
jgi:hypothetical protein